MPIPLLLRGALIPIMFIGAGISASVGAMYGYNKYNEQKDNKQKEQLEDSYVVHNEPININKYIEPHKDLQD